jgi:hypothetical protein
MSYQEDDDEEPGTDVGLAMEDIDVAATDLDYLMPQSCSLWHWEDYGLPELVSGELEHFLRTHSENAARRHSTASTEIEEWMRCAWRVETRRSPGGPRSTSRDNFVY